ncbi:MAG: NAD(P)/FAD-dependent oxidoreductase [Bacteroidales bacterium]|nr:NAD(P)/FAD-dependent oxidoreductase [Bacteroidales bacterium]
MKEFEFSQKISRPLTEEAAKEAAAKALGVRVESVGGTAIVRRSVDARGDILWRYRILAWNKGEVIERYALPALGDVSGAEEVIVVGAGPAGLFAALRLISEGFRPVILERGKDVHERKADMAALSMEGRLNPDSNYCYGEGGAGAFSDGKLYTRSSKRGDIREVLHRLVQAGAPEEILTDAHPHIGTDRLPEIMENIRKMIVSSGGEYHFSTRVRDISRDGNGLRLACDDLVNGVEKVYCAGNVILATGHSARDIYEMFSAKGWTIEPKGFALGVRVEHPQSLINNIRYHGKYQPFMPVAEYSFVQQVEGRGVFSFCMCPGGILVPSQTEEKTVVLNGMSNSRRNSKWANAGVVVQIEPGDEPDGYRSRGAFSLLDFQRDIERNMYAFSSSVKAPAQRMKDFCRGIESRDLPRSSYVPGTVPAPLHSLLPENVAGRLRKAFPQVERSMRGYYTNDALLLGVESRTSSPVRIPRDPETLEHVSVPGLYPAGEGAGYSGGIVSSALDGIACAMAIAKKK